MKQLKIRLESSSKRELKHLPNLSFASEYFKCESCGYTVRMLVRGDTARCSKCGGTMNRC